MATAKELLRYVMELDTRQAERGFDRVAKAGKDSADDIDDDFGGLSDRLKTTGGKMGKALIAGFSALGVGALLTKGITDAMDAAAGVRRLRGQFNLTAQDAERYGNLAGDLYKNGWGESLEEVQQAVGVTAQRLSLTTNDEIAKISEGILAVSQTWGEDFDAVVRSTSQLMQNNLAPNAEAALDLIVAAFQNGGNEAGDLLDTIDEYSQHWEQMGLDGEEALNQIIVGFQNGQRDADKTGDAIKEMFIRVTDESESTRKALEFLNLDVGEMRRAFLEGGDAAKSAFLDIIGRLQDTEGEAGNTEAAVALIGTQFEDLGTDALMVLGSIEGALGDTTGAAEKLADTVEETEWEKLQRRSESALREGVEKAAKGANAALEDLAWIVADTAGNDDLATWIRHGQDAFADVKSVVDDFDRSLLANAETWEEARKIAAEHTGGLLESEETYGKVMTAAEEAAMTLANEWNRTVRKEREELQRTVPQGLEHVAQLEAAAAAADEAADATDNVVDQYADLEYVTGQTEAKVRKLEQAFQDLRGEIDSKRELQNVMTAWDEFTTAFEEGLDDAGYKLDEVKLAVLDYAETLDGIPPTMTTDILALIDEGNFAEVDRRLAGLERIRVAQVQLRASWAAGQAIIKAAQTTIDAWVGQSGGIVTKPTLSVIGEAGPEAVVPLGHLESAPGASPLPGLNGTKPTTTINLTVNNGTLGASGEQVGRQIVDALERFYRSGGRPPRSQ